METDVVPEYQMEGRKMTIEEAIDWCDQFRDNIIKVGAKKEKYALALRAMRTAITALSKQMPKKVFLYLEKTGCAGCPSCGGMIEAHSSHKYCCYCGQALEWRNCDGK